MRGQLLSIYNIKEMILTKLWLLKSGLPIIPMVYPAMNKLFIFLLVVLSKTVPIVVTGTYTKETKVGKRWPYAKWKRSCL